MKDTILQQPILQAMKHFQSKALAILLTGLKLRFRMLGKTEGYDEILEKLKEADDDKFSRIRCPHCRWQPVASSRWTCFDLYQDEHPIGGCFTSWNTFDTRGVCPGCLHPWKRTTCLRCQVHSLHESWYE